jgi:hypothetical protein
MSSTSLEQTLSSLGIDIDVAISKFKEYFGHSQNIKFSFRLPADSIALPDHGLFKVIQNLEARGWRCKHPMAEQHIPDTDILSGWAYGIKDKPKLREYGVVGFVRHNRNRMIIEGTLYGHEENLNGIYAQMLDIFRQKFGKTRELKPRERYIWQI